MTLKGLIIILILNILGFLLFFSWYLPIHHGTWFFIDKTIFYWFNKQLANNKLLLWLVAITNCRAFDSMSLIGMSVFFIYFWRKQSTLKKRCHILAIAITMCLTIIIVQQLGHAIPVSHPSPTKIFSHINHVTQLIDFVTKDSSANSFPGDHGIVLMIFSCFMLRYFSYLAFLNSLLIIFFLTLPRIMIGAHWFSDIAVGSLSIVLVIMSWWLATPFSDYIINFISHKFNKSISILNCKLLL